MCQFSNKIKCCTVTKNDVMDTLNTTVLILLHLLDLLCFFAPVSFLFFSLLAPSTIIKYKIQFRIFLYQENLFSSSIPNLFTPRRSFLLERKKKNVVKIKSTSEHKIDFPVPGFTFINETFRMRVPMRYVELE